MRLPQCSLLVIPFSSRRAHDTAWSSCPTIGVSSHNCRLWSVGPHAAAGIPLTMPRAAMTTLSTRRRAPWSRRGASREQGSCRPRCEGTVRSSRSRRRLPASRVGVNMVRSPEAGARSFGSLLLRLRSNVIRVEVTCREANVGAVL